MEITIEHVYNEIKNMDRRVNERFDRLEKDHAELSKTVAKIETKLIYHDWLFGAVVVFLVGAIGKLLLFPGIG